MTLVMAVSLTFMTNTDSDVSGQLLKIMKHRYPHGMLYLDVDMVNFGRCLWSPRAPVGSGAPLPISKCVWGEGGGTRLYKVDPNFQEPLT